MTFSPYAYPYFGMLDAELWRAIRLVVDTGLHFKGWSRQQVMGEQFDVRAFHNQVLIDGELPMDALEKKIDRWVAATGGLASAN